MMSSSRPLRNLGLLAGLVLSFNCMPVECSAYDRRTPVVEAIEKVGSSVVNIRTEQIIKKQASPFFGFGDTFFDQFFDQFTPPKSYKTQSLGSGTIIDERGYLLTNAHVVEKASKIFVALLGDPKEREATLVGIDVRSDLAVIKVASETPLPFIKMGRSDNLFLGETVIAIGNPLGLENSVTTGVVSSPSRRIPDGKEGLAVFIQTDALINPGNSGGPLVNLNGELIGINTAIAQQAQGIGFAIPVALARRVAQELIEAGRVRPAYSGLFAEDISSAMSLSRGAGGALVKQIDKGSPAFNSGIRTADVILQVDGIQVDTASEFLALMRTYPPGAEVELELLRGVKTSFATFQLTAFPKGYIENYVLQTFGLILADSRRGVMVKETRPGSAADQILIKSGDYIAEVEGQKVRAAGDFYAEIERTFGRIPLRFLIVRANRGYLIELP
ncbi:MAG: trypsin-like peptidase domain-containing protein [Deltaproteobacteria bacterium]|nr:trypsin-like peptidase domain-containing protein [Deltaproteobacteria bacterium]